MVSRRSYLVGLTGALGGATLSGSLAYRYGEDKGKEIQREEMSESHSKAFYCAEPPDSNGRRIHNSESEDTIDVGDYVHRSFSTDREVRIQYQVYTSGNRLDVLVIDSGDWEEYKSDGTGGFYPLASDIDTSRAVKTHVLRSGEYHFVLDNTTTETDPEGPVDVNFRVRAYTRDPERQPDVNCEEDYLF